jgi:hypothetical protein
VTAKNPTPEEREAMDMVDAIYEFAEDNRWTMVKSGVNKKYAWAQFSLMSDCGHLAVYYGIADATGEAPDDKFIFGKDAIPKELIRPIVESGTLEQIAKVLLDAGIDRYKDLVNGTGEYAAPVPPTVPPTSAAHSEGADPVPPIEGSAVPPTSTDAAHQGDESAAHTEVEVPPILDDDSPFTDDGEDRVSNTTDPEFVDPYGETDDFVAAESIAHIKDVEKQKSDTYAQQMIYDAVRDQQASGSRRNWSTVASELSNEALVKRVKGKTVHWTNSFTGRTETAKVTKDGGKHPTKVTPSNFDVEAAGEDMRLLHFLEEGGGFRSVAVARIVKVG